MILETVQSLDQLKNTRLTLVGDTHALAADFLEGKGDRRARGFAEQARQIYTEIQAFGDLQRIINRHRGLAGTGDPVLSAAERRVVTLVIEGCTNAEIAQQLFLSVKTVETHLARIYRRFGVKSRLQLVRYCESNDTVV
jgi:DNA-binding CsgD family transcriptional regulator